MPAGACDCHMHIFGPTERHAPITAADYVPADALYEDYIALRLSLGLSRTVVVQPSIYGLDHACTAEAVERLGESGRGVAVLAPDVHDSEIEYLHSIGFRGIRFNLVSSGGVAADAFETMAARVAEYCWHVQVMVTGDAIASLAPRLAGLPVDVVIDHMGRFDAIAEAEPAGFRSLLSLLEGGRCWVKLSGAYRIDFGGAPWPMAAPLAKTLIAAAPERLLWGTDWPHPDLGTSPMPDDAALLDALAAWTAKDALLQRILVDNPAALYDFAPEVGS